MDLTEVLRAAAAEPPPTRIDLDALVRGERRRERQQRWLTAGGVAVGLAVSVGVATPGLLGGLHAAGGGSPPSCPAFTPPPSDFPTLPGSPAPSGAADPGSGSASPASPLEPTEPCADAVARLDRALTDALHATLPRARLTNGSTGDLPAVWFERAGDGAYVATVGVHDGDRAGLLRIKLSGYAEAPEGTQACPTIEAEQCTVNSAGDGTVTVRRRLPRVDIGDNPVRMGEIYEVVVFRPDGTKVVVSHYPPPSAGSSGGPSASPSLRLPPLPVTLDQVDALAHTPGLTLFP